MESKLPPSLKLKLPLISVVSKSVRLLPVSIVILLKVLLAEVKLVVPSNIQVEPVEVKVSAGRLHWNLQDTIIMWS